MHESQLVKFSMESAYGKGFRRPSVATGPHLCYSQNNSGLWLVFRRRTDAYTTGSQISETVCKPPALGVRRKPKVPVDDTHLFSGGFPWPDQQTPSPS